MRNPDRRRSMTRHIGRTIFLIAALSLMATNVSAADSASGCSLRGVAGEWGYTFSGTLFPEGAEGGVIFAGTGKYSSDVRGNVSSTQTISTGGAVARDTTDGTITVNSDCTASIEIDVYDEEGELLRISKWDVVFVDNQAEVFGVMASMEVPVAPNTFAQVPSVATMQAKRTLPSAQRAKPR